MKYLWVLMVTLPLFSCGFDKSFISSVSTIGEKTRGPVRIIRGAEVSLHFGPRNHVKTGESNYVVLPVVPIGGNSDEVFAYQQTKGEFIVGLSLFAHKDALSLDFSDITLNLKQTKYKVVDVKRNPYAHYPNSQASRVGDKNVLCPKSQQFKEGLPNEEIDLKNNGLWECYDLVFPIDAPSPRMTFQLEVIVMDETSGRHKTFQVPFEPYKWGHSDSFP